MTSLVRNKKIILALGVVVVVALLAPSAVFAEGESSEPSFNILSCASEHGVFGCSVFGLTVVISYIGGLLVQLAAWAIKLALIFNSTLLKSPVVQIGFSVMLNLANLGFVIGLIVIAFATMLRRQTYGMKQLLFKFVLMAVLVNFSLVIAGVAINFADDLSFYLLAQIAGPSEPGDGFVATSVSVHQWSSIFALKLSSAFKPQALLEGPEIFGDPPQPDVDPADNTSLGFITNILEGTAGGVVDDIIGNTGPGSIMNVAARGTRFALDVTRDPFSKADDFLAILGNLVFAVVFTFLIALSMLAVAMMLWVRYIYLGVLLILMPAAWLSAVFPKLQQHWNAWWEKFFKWLAFAPTVLFFLYLAMFIMLDKGGQAYLGDVINATPNNPPIQEAGLAVGLASGRAVHTIANAIFMIALTIGGIFAASKLSIKFSDTAMNWAKSTGNWATGKLRGGAARGARRAGAFGLGRERSRKAAEWMQKVGKGGNAFQRFITAPVRAGGRGLENVGAGAGSAAVEEFTEDVKGYTKSQVLGEVGGTTSTPKRLALLERAKEEGYLQEAVDALPAGAFNREAFTRYGKEKLFDNAGGKLKELIDNGEAFNEDGSVSSELAKALRKLEPKQFLKYLKAGDDDQPPLDISRGTMGEFKHTILQGSTRMGWNSFQEILKAMNPEDLSNFHGVAKELVDEGKIGYQDLVAGGIHKPLEKGAISSAYYTDNVFGIARRENNQGGNSGNSGGGNNNQNPPIVDQYGRPIR